MQPTRTPKSQDAALEQLWGQVCASRGTPAPDPAGLAPSHYTHLLPVSLACVTLRQICLKFEQIFPILIVFRHLRRNKTLAFPY